MYEGGEVSHDILAYSNTRILALSYSTATLSAEVWEEAVRLDSEVEERLEQRDKARMERNFGQLAS